MQVQAYKQTALQSALLSVLPRPPAATAAAAGVFAAGDCCTVAPGSAALHWFQMRLWSQARLMGCHAAAAMSGALEEELQPLSFELVSLGRLLHVCAFTTYHDDHHDGVGTRMS